MFQRFSTRPANREGDYKFCDLRDFQSDSDEEKNSTPEKLILKELHHRNKNSPLGINGRKKLSPLARNPIPVISPEHVTKDEDKFSSTSDDFVVEFKQDVSPVAESKEKDQEPHGHHVRFDVYSDVQTPVKPAVESVLVSPDVRFKSQRETTNTEPYYPDKSENSLLVSPDFRFKSGRGKKLSEKESRSPLAPVNNRREEMAFDVEDVEDEFDTEQLFSRIRHNRIQFVVEAFENGCDPFLMDANGNSMLHICAQNNLKKMANLCIKQGCDLNARNRKGMTPLDYCDMLKFSALAEWMVIMGAENGTIVNQQGQRSHTAANFHSTRGMR